jgi:hypothetical protein
MFCFSQFVYPILIRSNFVILCGRTAVFIFGFTKIGFGTEVFYFIGTNLYTLRYSLGIALPSFMFTLYLFDVQHWSSEIGSVVRGFCYGLVVAASGILVLSISSDHPYGPIAVFVVLLPFYLAGVKWLLYYTRPNREYIHWLSGPLFLVSFATLITWVVWTYLHNDNEWNLGVSLNDAIASGCVANYDDYPDCDAGDGTPCFEFDDADYNTLNFDRCIDGEVCQQIFEKCYNPFIIWVGPFLACLGLLFLSFFASFLRSDGSTEQEASKFAKVWLFLLFGMWVTTSLAGAGAGVSTTLMALTLALFIASAIFVNIAFDLDEKQGKMKDIVDLTMEKYGSMMNVFRGLLVVTCTPVFFVYLVISFIIQRIRCITSGCYSSPADDTMSLRTIPGAGWFTIEVRRLLRTIQAWNITRVFTIALYWGLAFMIMYVIVAQYTLVFLSWLIQVTSDMNLGLVTAILIGVGMLMFLAPPVPGVPIYLTLGIVIIPVGKEVMGITLSICYAMAVSLALKLSACTLQQKMIGGLLQSSVPIRQLVGVNSDIIRAMKLVLREPGFGIAKVSILVGGPDWPTSVLCGIMDLKLLPVLVGTLPIVFLILPTLLTGSFTYMADARDENGELEFPWAGTMATVFAALTAFVQFGSMVVAAYFLERVIAEKQEELEQIPIDEEVKQADERDEAHREAFEEISRWDRLPALAKCTLSLSLACMIISCYLVQLFAGECFRDYQLTYTIETHLDGDWRTLTKPLGVLANILLASSVMLLIAFNTWANVSLVLILCLHANNT